MFAAKPRPAPGAGRHHQSGLSEGREQSRVSTRCLHLRDIDEARPRSARISGLHRRRAPERRAANVPRCRHSLDPSRDHDLRTRRCVDRRHLDLHPLAVTQPLLALPSGRAAAALKALHFRSASATRSGRTTERHYARWMPASGYENPAHLAVDQLPCDLFAQRDLWRPEHAITAPSLRHHEQNNV